MKKILIVYYSRFGHVYQLARAIAEGVQQVEGIEIVLRRVEDFESTKKANAENPLYQKLQKDQADIPICTHDDLIAADAIIWGSPTRYGNMCAEMKALIDSTPGLWLKGVFEGKPTGVFTSTASTHGGQETTLISMMIPLLHLGMIIVGVPYSVTELIHTEGRGGSPYGPSTIAGGRGELNPAPEDLVVARALGKRVATITKQVRQ